MRRTFGVLTALSKDIFRSRYHTEVLSGAFYESFLGGHELKLFSMKETEYGTLDSILKEHHVDGLMVLAWRWLGPHLIDLLESTNGRTPLVLFNDYTRDIKTNIVYTDVGLGIEQAVDFLSRKGYKKIGMLRGPESIPFAVNGKEIKVPFIDAQEKLEGFIRGLKKSGMAFNPEWVRMCEAYREDYAYDATAAWIKTGNYPRAIICGNDDVAIGALRAIQQSGLECPRDMALIGFDNTEKAQNISPALTTIAQPLYEMGREAVKILIQKIEGKSDTPVQLSFPSELVVRESA